MDKNRHVLMCSYPKSIVCHRSDYSASTITPKEKKKRKALLLETSQKALTLHGVCKNGLIKKPAINPFTKKPESKSFAKQMLETNGQEAIASLQKVDGCAASWVFVL